MISWLQGRYMECWSQGNRSGIVLVCHSVGYEVQLTARHMHLLDQDDDLALWIHQVQREDGSSLFGFPEREERDLFRMLIGVNGIGPQSGLSLLQECKPTELVQAIGNGDIRRLCRAQGIGKRTAERLAVDLRKPITTLKGIEPKPSLVEGIDSELMKETANEVSTTLIALGYDDLEIRRAIKEVYKSEDEALPSPQDQEALLRGCLQLLSQDSA